MNEEARQQAIEYLESEALRLQELAKTIPFPDTQYPLIIADKCWVGALVLRNGGDWLLRLNDTCRQIIDKESAAT